MPLTHLLYNAATPTKVTKLTFTEGKVFGNGGWYQTEPSIEIDTGNRVWQPATGQRISPSYTQSNKEGATSFESFEFSFNAVEVVGIRLTGTAGGSAMFISVGELRVTSAVGADC